MKEFPGNSGIFHSETENVGLPLELHIDIVHHDQFLDVDPLPLDELGPLPNLVLKSIPYGFHVHLLQRKIDGTDVIMTHIGSDTTHGVGDSWAHRHQNLGNPHFPCQSGCMQRTGSAKGEEDKIPGIMPSGQGHQPQGTCHVGVCNS